MTFDEYKEKIDALLTSPDTALADVGGVYEALREDLTALNALTEEHEALEERIRELKETNIRLYLAQQGETVEEQEEEADEDRDVEDFFSSL